MSKEALVGAVKQAMTLARSGEVDKSNETYRALYASPDFGSNTPADMRQALKLLILAKRGGKNPDSLVEAHRAALAPLTALVAAHSDPEDFEMLGLCHLITGNDAEASNLFRQGLTLERERNPASDLCGRLMTRVAAI